MHNILNLRFLTIASSWSLPSGTLSLPPMSGAERGFIEGTTSGATIGMEVRLGRTDKSASLIPAEEASATSPVRAKKESTIDVLK